MMRTILLLLILAHPLTAADPIGVTVECTLPSASGQIRQFAFDGDEKTWFATTKAPEKDDSFTLILDNAIKVKSLKVLTGRPTGSETLVAGELEVSADGNKFEMLSTFKDGAAEGKPESDVKAIRVRCTAKQEHILAIREITIGSEPPVAVFKYPVEFVLDVADAPDMKVWAEKVVKVCERQYYMLNEELTSENYKPRSVINMAFKKDYKGVAEAGGGRIRGSVTYFKAHPDDIGALVHETAHVVQNYRTRNNPGWLVEGIADYVRFYKYEAVKPKLLSPQRAKFDGSYRTSAAFLDFLVTTHDKEIVRKLNKAMREGEYTAELFKTHTKKSLTELDEEWKTSLRK